MCLLVLLPSKHVRMSWGLRLKRTEFGNIGLGPPEHCSKTVSLFFTVLLLQYGRILGNQRPRFQKSYLICRVQCKMKCVWLVCVLLCMNVCVCVWFCKTFKISLVLLSEPSHWELKIMDSPSCPYEATLQASYVYREDLGQRERRGGHKAVGCWQHCGRSKSLLPALQLYPCAIGATGSCPFCSTSGTKVAVMNGVDFRLWWQIFMVHSRLWAHGPSTAKNGSDEGKKISKY